MIQPALFDAPPGRKLIQVILCCPNCQRIWHACTIDLSSWWAKDCTPTSCAKECHCICGQHPPMRVQGVEEQAA